MSPWLLPLPLWLSPVSCRAQTPMPAMGHATCPLFLHSALLKLRRLHPPSRPISGSSNRRNTRTASRWTKWDGGAGAASLRDNRKQVGRVWIHQRIDELYDDIHKRICTFIFKYTYIHSKLYYRH